jgi:hypothetical protein
MIGQQVIIRIQEDHIGAVALSKPPVPGFGDTLIGLMEVSHVGILLHYLIRIIRRAIIDDDNLITLIGLRMDAFNRFTQIHGLLIAGNYDADEIIV